MNRIPPPLRRRRRGLSMTEVVVTVVITSAAMVGGLKLMSLADRQCRTIDNHRLACLEAGNVLEQIMARPWDEVVPGQESQWALSAACATALPDAKMRVVVEADAASAEARRITVEIDWQATAIRRSQPVRMVAWRYRNREVQP